MSAISLDLANRIIEACAAARRGGRLPPHQP